MNTTLEPRCLVAGRTGRPLILETSAAAWAVLLLLAGPPPGHAQEGKLLTVAEKSGYRATSRHAQVVDFCERLAKAAPAVVRLGELGTTTEGRKLPLLILADPPIATPEEAAASGKLVVYAQGDIHAGEVDGKEGLCMLARDIATAADRPLLKDLVIVIAPIFNADGNDRMAKTNRPGQLGPEEGMGTRANAQGFDLNRDFMKLESPEVRALVRFLNRWDPAVLVDTHTTDGSFHRYLITYDGPRNAAADPKLVETVRDTMLPDMGRGLEKIGGYKSFFYGDFNRDHTRWVTYPAEPRYGIQYVGLRGRIAILSESYSYAPYRDRVLASRDFVRAILDYTAQNHSAVRKLMSQVRDATVRAGKDPKAADRVAVRQKTVSFGKPVTALGFVEERKNGRTVATDKPHDYTVEYWGLCEPATSVERPYAYLFPASLTHAVENLQRHGIRVEELREDIELDLEVAKVTKVHRAKTAFQKHHLELLDATVRPETRRVEAGTILVRTGQALGTLAAYLLEPESEDGLATWNFFDDVVAEGKDFPVLRLPKELPITAGPVRPLAEERVRNKPVIFDTVYGSDPVNFAGNPVANVTWLDDGEHFLQVKSGRLYKVHAVSGRVQPLFDPDKLARALAALPTIGKQRARSLARGTRLHMNPQHTGALITHDNDLYFAAFDGSQAVRLTKTPGTKELAEFSPDGKFVAFVRDHNLYVVDIATQTERALTSDGDASVSNGKADWVYFEEIFSRNWRAYWWSPDSAHLAFVHYDDRPVHRFTVLDEIPLQQKVENTAYPIAGDPNPLVKLGVVPVGGGPVCWADTSGYSPTASLLIRAGWTPDSHSVYFYVQDRAQTWLDFCTVPVEGGTPKRLFRDTTRAWVDDPGAPVFLKDGSFLLSSERTGWRHLYHFDKDGSVKATVTSGPWELGAVTSGPFRSTAVQAFDEKDGWVYVTGTRDSPIAANLYRVKLDGSSLQRLTKSPGDHRVLVSPKGTLFVDWQSSHTTPTRVALCRTDGSLVRTLDTNPVRALEEYRFGKEELVQIPTSDGFQLEGSVVTPPDFDPKRRYPVWFMTYGGPHAPTVHDSWGRSWGHDQLLANMGFVVFHCDPRSASGKGAVSAWACYRQLGVQELKDIETAIGWLTKHCYVDASRIGMSGSSYGGFMTEFAMTHSKLFAAGIAGAPVTDWRNYDTIYTERYMNTPQENPQGYDATSVVKAARNLHGNLLIVHGLMDDNVHVANTVQFIQELQKADKDFELMIYPRARHGGFGKHYSRLSIDFIKRTLGESEGKPAAAGVTRTSPEAKQKQSSP
jgi:dipeptidyl aminopeptidase/acylaminoacyl peptidase